MAAIEAPDCGQSPSPSTVKDSVPTPSTRSPGPGRKPSSSSRFQNPTGASFSVARQSDIRRIARGHGAFVIEDDFARHMTHADASAPPLPMIAGDPYGTVIQIRSLTKVTSPNLRVGALAARGPVAAKL